MSASSFYEEVDTLALTRYFSVVKHAPSGRWIVSMNPCSLNGYAEQKLPPGQAVCVSYSPEGLEVSRDHEAEPGDWACIPRFLSRESANREVLRWLKSDRADLYEECMADVREAIIWRQRQLPRGT